MKKLTNTTKLNSFFPTKTLGGLLTAGVLLFGAASCGSERGNEENAVAEEQVDEGLGYEGLDDGQDVNNLAVDDNFGEWDANDDNMWDENEFETVSNDSGLFSDWDADNDGLFSDDELNEGFYDVYDADDDNRWSEDEFNTWNTAWGGEYGDNWDAWDANDDNFLDADEYNAGIGEAGVYNEWDTDNDGLFSNDEVNNGLYNTWDADEDGYLNEEEYNNVGYNFWGI